MSFTMTRTTTESFTLAHAKELASKVTADMRRCQQIYGKPEDAWINAYGTELALLLNQGFVEEYEFGFLRTGARILSWSYTVNSAGQLTTNDRPGRMVTGIDISGADWFNRLNKTRKFWSLPKEQRERFEAELPVKRTVSDPPPDGAGRWVYDLNYSAGGVTLGRKTFQPL
jgi:Bacterial HORMA domain family 1